MLVKDALYAGAPKLKLIQLLSAGYDRADLTAARKAKVPISNNGGANSVAVSEHALLLMLAVSRKLIQQHANVTGGRWRGNSVPKVNELRGKTLGIIGLGTIGKKTARLAQAFGVIVHLLRHRPHHRGGRRRAQRALPPAAGDPQQVRHRLAARAPQRHDASSAGRGRDRAHEAHGADHQHIARSR